MKRFLGVLLLLLICSTAFAQGSLGGGIYSNAARRIAGLGAASLPATCAVGDVFVPSGAPIVLYLCTATNAWTAFLTSSTGVPSTRTINTTSPLGGGGDLSADRTLTCTTCLVSGGALGTPSSGTATNITGLPISTGVSGLASGIPTFLGTATSANLRSALSDETGTGAAVFVGPTVDLAFGASQTINTGGTSLMEFVAGNSGSAGIRFKNASLTNHWVVYETMGAAGQQGAFNVQDSVAAVDRFRIDTSGSVILPLQGMTAGTMTVTNSANVRTVIHRFDWTNAMVTALGATTAGDVSVCVLPAKTVVRNVYVVIDTPDTSTNALTVAVGRVSATYIDYIVASDAKAAANTVYGDASAERGTNLTDYDLPSVAGTTTINAHFIKTTTNLNTVTGSTGHVYVETEVLP